MSPQGYAIYDDESGTIEELMPCAENYPYDFGQDKEYYYAGPMNYLEKDGETFISLSDNTVLNNEDIEYFENLISEITVKRSIVTYSVPKNTITAYMLSTEYFTNLLGNNYGTNSTGICMHIACEIMLGYYDSYINDNIVPNAYESSTDYGTNVNFIPYLQIYLGTSSCGLAQATSGLNNYFSAIYFSEVTAKCDIGNHNTVFARVGSYISKNRPVVAAMFHSYNSACPIDHRL